MAVPPTGIKVPLPPNDMSDVAATRRWANELVHALEARNVRVNAALLNPTVRFTGTFTTGTAQTVTVVDGVIVSVS